VAVQAVPGSSITGRQLLGRAQRQFAVAVANRALDALSQAAEPGEAEGPRGTVEIVGGAAQLAEVALADDLRQLGQEFLDAGAKIADVLACLVGAEQGNQGINVTNIDVGRTHGLGRWLQNGIKWCQGSANNLFGQVPVSCG
jgi:hypothetical protein